MSSRVSKAGVWWRRFSKALILGAFVLFLTLVAPNSFPTISNISNVLWSISTIGIMATGSIFVILVGGIDLSLGSIMALSGVATVMSIRAFDFSTLVDRQV